MKEHDYALEVLTTLQSKLMQKSNQIESLYGSLKKVRGEIQFRQEKGEQLNDQELTGAVNGSLALLAQINGTIDAPTLEEFNAGLSEARAEDAAQQA